MLSDIRWGELAGLQNGFLVMITLNTAYLFIMERTSVVNIGGMGLRPRMGTTTRKPVIVCHPN